MLPINYSVITVAVYFSQAFISVCWDLTFVFHQPRFGVLHTKSLTELGQVKLTNLLDTRGFA